MNITIDLEPNLAALMPEILKELDRAENKHPDFPTELTKQALVILEEAGEMVREINHVEEGFGVLVLVRKELVETVVTCLRMLKNFPTCL